MRTLLVPTSEINEFDEFTINPDKFNKDTFSPARLCRFYDDESNEGTEVMSMTYDLDYWKNLFKILGTTSIS